MGPLHWERRVLATGLPGKSLLIPCLTFLKVVTRCLSFLKNIFIYLAAQALVAGPPIFVGAWKIFTCSMWDLVPWPGIEPCIGNLESGPPGKSLPAPCWVDSQQWLSPQAAPNAEAHLCPSLCSLSLLPSDLPAPSLLLGPTQCDLGLLDRFS